MKNVSVILEPCTWLGVDLTFHGAVSLARHWRRELEQRLFADRLGVPDVDVEQLRQRLDKVERYKTSPEFIDGGGVRILLTLPEFSQILLPEWSPDAPTHLGEVFIHG